MALRAASGQRVLGQARAELHERLLSRRVEIERTLHTRVYALADPAETLDPEYRDGLRAAVTSALDYGLEIIRLGGERAPPPPAPLLTQVRLAARNRIGLDTVLRRYFAGFALLNDFLLGEAAQESMIGAATLREMIRSHAALFDRILAAVSEEYVREDENRPERSLQRRHAERVERLLAGELLDASELGYELDASHLGLIASGPGGEEAIRDLAASLDCSLLFVCRGDGRVWAWFGTRRRIEADALRQATSPRLPAEVSFAIGEPGHGLPGWRLTHRQAAAALSIALRRPGEIARYADIALLASMLQDDLLVASLHELFLAPLAQGRDDGAALCETLRAYFAAGRNLSSAAAALGVNRRTVSNRLRVVEEQLGLQLDSCAAQMEAALRLQDLGHPLLPYAALS